jgi:hypothetical protein
LITSTCVLRTWTPRSVPIARFTSPSRRQAATSFIPPLRQPLRLEGRTMVLPRAEPGRDNIEAVHHDVAQCATASVVVKVIGS